jgi:hypothetical protein
MVVEALTQLTLGGPMHVYHGGLQVARFRYFDAAGKRPGLPQGVAALVDGLTHDGATLTLVNTDAVHAAEVVIQGGVFGEHDFTSVTLGDAAPVAVSGRWLTVKLAAGATARLTLGMQRFANAPSYDTPWVRAADGPVELLGREG